MFVSRLCAAVVLSVVASGLVACSTHANGTASLGTVGSGAPSLPALPSGPSLSPLPGGGTGGGGTGGSGGGHSTHSSGGGSGHSNSASASTSSSSAKAVDNDYAVTVAGMCYWTRYYDAGNYLLQLGADFMISYAGTHATVPVQFVLTNDQQAGSTSGLKTAGSTFKSFFGTQLADASNPYLNKTVKITATITVTDDVAANNTVSRSVTVPGAGQLPTDTDPHPLPCS
jgi:hypothetical protein